MGSVLCSRWVSPVSPSTLSPQGPEHSGRKIHRMNEKPDTHPPPHLALGPFLPQPRGREWGWGLRGRGPAHHNSLESQISKHNCPDADCVPGAFSVPLHILVLRQCLQHPGEQVALLSISPERTWRLGEARTQGVHSELEVRTARVQTPRAGPKAPTLSGALPGDSGSSSNPARPKPPTCQQPWPCPQLQL